MDDSSPESGGLRGKALLSRILSVPFRDRDAWVNELLGFDDATATPDVPDLPRESVPYLPCGVDEILGMSSEVPLGPDDELVDLGSGLGRVVILAHLLTGARAKGIEIQRPLVEKARSRARALGLDVSFTHANAADEELDGSVFFLYAPFSGRTLRGVIARVEAVARRRPVVVCAVGLELRDVPWLAARTTSCAALSIYDSTFTRSA